MTDRIFISRLTGTAVFDPQGDQLGKVRDTLVHLRHSNNPPRIIGLLVEVPQRRIVFVPISSVPAFNAYAPFIVGLADANCTVPPTPFCAIGFNVLPDDVLFVVIKPPVWFIVGEIAITDPAFVVILPAKVRAPPFPANAKLFLPQFTQNN